MNWVVRFLLVALVPLASLLADIPTPEQLRLVNKTVDITDGTYHECWVDLTVHTPHPIQLKRTWDGRKGTWSIEPQGNSDLIVTRDDKERVIDAYTLLGWIHFNYLSSTGPNVDVETSEGQRIAYRFEEQTGLLRSVRHPDNQTTTYEYEWDDQNKIHHLVHRQESNGNYLSTHYQGKVIEQQAPVGSDETPVTIARFSYNPQRTSVYDALQHQTVYHFSREGTVTAIETWLQGAPYKKQLFEWNQDLLTSQSICDANNTPLITYQYTYDSLHNLVQETIRGDLSGKGSSHECYTVTYEYQEKCLIAERHPNGKSITYSYAPNSKNITAKFVWDGKQVRQRSFYEYNSKDCIIRTIQDDGSSLDKTDLTNAIQRTVAVIIPRMSSPGFGLPQLIDEKYTNLDTGEEILLRTQLNHFDSQGRITRREAYDADGNCLQWEQLTYDDQGRMISKAGPAGNQQEATFDPSGHVATSISSNNQLTQYTYDFAGRVIAEDVTDAQNVICHTTHLYDAAGRKVATTDYCGNTTRYEYDEIGRLLRTVYPPAADGLSPTVSYSYNILDQLVSCTDANGYCTFFTYNVRGQPTHILYPDGSQEGFTYYLDGALAETRSRSGMATRFKRDALGRVTLSDSGNQQTHASYSGFQLTSVTDPSGLTTLYTYDSAGRLKSESKGGSSGTLTELSYDSSSRVHRKQWYGQGDGQFTQSTVDRDPDTQSITWQIVSHTHQQLAGQTPSQPQLINEKTTQQQIINSLGQKVLQTTETDPSGLLTISTRDAIGRIVAREIRDAFGTVLDSYAYTYDPAGNKVKEVRNGHYALTYSYGPMNRLESVTENSDTATFYAYDTAGRLASQTKPDGTTLFYNYDNRGHLTRLHSSDGSVDYHYHYDLAGNISLVEDAVHHTSTARQHDLLGRLVSEKLANELTFQYTYDRSGRLLSLSLPDQTGIQKEFDGTFLKAIHRTDTNGNVLYSHRYNAFSKEGQLIESQLIGSLGTTTFTHNSKGHRTSISSSYWSESIDEDCYDSANRLLKVRYSDPEGPYSCRYAYDVQGQLIAEGGVQMRDYRYDEQNNRVQKGSSLHKHNENNQLTQNQQQHYQYDANGNLIQRREGHAITHYSYDALDRLIAVEMGNDRWEYSYDAFHRRLAKSHLQKSVSGSWEPNTYEAYLYQYKQEIGAADAQGRIYQLRLLGLGIDADVGSAVALELNGQVLAPIHDHRGSVTCLVDALTHEVVEFYRYSAFGEEEIFGQEDGNALNPWRFSSKRHDAESGLIFFGNRYYDPELGRWVSKDPQGTPDGLNRYAFVKNNPLTLVDPHGLFSFHAEWQNVVDAVWDYVRPYSSHIAALIDFIQRDSNLLTDLREDLEFLGHSLIGPGVFSLLGYKVDNIETGVYGNGEVSDRIRISHINGILTYKEECVETLKMLSRFHGGTNIHYVFRPTDGWSHDIINAILIKFGFTSYTASALADKWKILIEDMGGPENGGLIIHYAHSLGGVETANARHMMTPAEQAMIRVFTFGSPTMLSQTGFESVTNYVSRRDGVCLLDPIGYVTALLSYESNVVFLGPFGGIPFVDHLITNENYSRALEELGQIFIKNYGIPKEK